jgi:tetratricopeptide (TPR) repeat protein
VWEFARATEQVLQLRRIVRRETVRLVVLTAIAGAVFLGTRLLAERAEQQELEDAQRWHQRGVELLPSSPERAAVAFRRAVIRHRGERRYVLALAEALAGAGTPDAAVRALQGLREFSPEDAEVNLALARLYRNQEEFGQALRFYHHAIYAPDSTPERAREVRLELVHMLLDAGDSTRAESELIALTIDLPDAPDVRVALARLFERAGSHTRAAAQYQRVLKAAPRNLGALEGAVRTAFTLGNYREVLGYRLPDEAADNVRELGTIAREIVARDPLAARLSAAERRRRLLGNILYLEQRWVACGDAAKRERPQDFPAELVALRTTVRPASIGRDVEALEQAVAAIDGLRSQIEKRCHVRTATDHALEIIARSHGVPAS